MDIRSAFVIAVLIVVSGCGSVSAPTADQPELADTVNFDPANVEYRIRPGDELDVRFFSAPELNETIIVRPDGKISLQLIPDVLAAGMTPSELDAQLSEAYSSELREPNINVVVRSFSGQQIFIGGEVEEPGIVVMASPLTVLEAVIQAGGFTDGARTGEILVIRRGPENRPISFKVDLKQTLQGDVAATPLLTATDVVYVPKSKIANANLFVDQYIRQLLLFEGFRAGYDVNDP